MYNLTKFADGQLSTDVWCSDSTLNVNIRGTSYEDLFKAASAKEAWDYMNRKNTEATATLTIACLVGQRSDRRFKPHGSFDLKVIANFINSMGYDEVKIVHPHSSVALALIDNSTEISVHNMVAKAIRREKQAYSEPVTLVSPDAGAYKRVAKYGEELNRNVLAANKIRVDGKPQIVIQGDVPKHCLIVDDIADGGRTFTTLTEKLKELGAKRVALYVTHGMFHYGIGEQFKAIDHIYCTTSYRRIEDSKVTQFPIQDIL